ncbi:HNH endonuclease [Sphingomonas gilva]|uniref:HNH endonuclease n=1 Tax=Sphingomonas gilva TaxID=2305907 RepID=A0A396RPI8_9SPHN|nr:HNH endonuclease [Sphingomonas gilva]RHW17172.1 HNH endonuclease [Sphingomonas gilva]
MKGRAIHYSAEELTWLEENREMSRRDLHRLFVMFFGRDDVSPDHIKALCSRKGWKTGRTGQFAPGMTPSNKGKSMPFNANSARTQFKKGSMSGRARALYKPIGTERLSKEGYVERKIHDGLPLQSRWRAVHLIRWEEQNGPLPRGMCLKCLDANRLNTDPSNWAAIPRALLPRLAGRWTMPYDSAPDELKPVILAMAKVKHAAKERASDAG